jgi:hypothetical protein
MIVRDFEIMVKPAANPAGRRGYATVVRHAGRELVRSWESDEAAAHDFADYCSDRIADGYTPAQGDGPDEVDWRPPARLAAAVTAYRTLPDDDPPASYRDAEDAAFVEDYMRARGYGRTG